MKFSEIELPSNKKFGLFFSLVFLILLIYFYKNDHVNVACFFAATLVIFSFVTIVKADLLLPLNKLWMRFGILLGMIVSPIVLSLIFFGLFTPIALLMRIFGRDELRLKMKSKNSYWVELDKAIHPAPFKQQF
jgi:hypothetical protein